MWERQTQRNTFLHMREKPEMTADSLASRANDDVSLIEEDLRLLEQAGYIVASKENKCI